MDKKQQISVWYVLLAVMVLVSMQSYLGGHTETLAYSDFKRLLGAGKLDDLTVSDVDVDVRGTVRTDGLSSLLLPEKIDALQRTGEGRHAFVTIRVEDDKLAEALEADGVTLAGRRRPGAQDIDHSAWHWRTGLHIQRPTEDRFLMTLEELDNKMAVLLGGRAAEHLVFEQLSTGASNDLAKATDIARSMVMRYGMDDSLGPVVYQESSPHFLDQPGILPRMREVSNETAEKIDQAVRSQVQSAFEQARAILDTHRGILERGAKLLLAQETLTEPELATLQQALPIAATQRAAPGEPS